MKNIVQIPLSLAAAALLTISLANVVRADHGDNNGQNNQTRLRARLTGPAISGKTPEGQADFRSDDKGRTRLNVEVEDVNLPAGTMLTVSLTHGGTTASIGSIKLSALGAGELELNSQDGDVVPAVQTGDTITVSNGGTAILVGVF